MRVTTMTPFPENEKVKRAWKAETPVLVNESKQNPRNIEDVSCIKTRLKILRVLMDSQLTASEITRTVSVNYVNVAKHLEVLEVEGILTHIKFGRRIRYYKLNENSPKAKTVRNLIEAFQMCEVF